MRNKQPEEKSILAKLAIGNIIAIMAIVGLAIIILYRMNDSDTFNQMWARYSTVLCVLGTIGAIAVWNQLKKDKIDGLSLLITLIVLFGVQFLLGIFGKLQISETEQGLYYVFAAVTEELFFRGFILTPVKDSSIHLKIGALFVSGAVFAILHFNYYGDWIMLSIVFISGCILGIVYLQFKSLTVCILAHLILNAIIAFNLLYS